MEYFSSRKGGSGFRKLLFAILFFTTSFFSQQLKAQSYCIPVYGYGACDEFISSVVIGTINNGSSCNNTQYEDFSSTFTDVTQSLNEPITVTVGPPSYTGDEVAIFVDWNQDYDFLDAGEMAGTLTDQGGGIFSGTVNVPLTATLGLTRMRVMMTYFTTPAGCNENASFFGESEDYSVNVQPAPSCLFPTSLNVTNITTSTADLNWTGDASAISYSVRYKRTIDPPTVSSWATPTVVPAPMTTLSLSGLTEATTYEFQVISYCSASDSSGFVNSVLWTTLCFDCPLSSIAEGEACGADVNGGCNMAIPYFEPINCGDTICGTGWADLGTRDTDWYTFTVTTPGVYTIFAKSQFPAIMGYIGPNAACPITSFTDVTTNSNECDSLSLTAYLSAGTWIYFVAPFTFYGYPCGSGYNNYLTYVCAPNPPVTVVNDDCGGAILLTQNATCVPTTGDVTGAFIQSGPGCTGGYGDDDLWYKFVATSSAAVIQVTGSSSFDPVVELYDACGGNLLSCIDNTFTGGTESQTLGGLTAGSTYYIRVYDWYLGTPVTTTFDICVFDAPPSILPNDDCVNAISVSCGDTITGTTTGALNDIAGFCGTQPVAPGVWYTMVGDGSIVTLSLCNNTFYDSKINVYSGSCGSLTCVNGNDDFCGLQSQTFFSSQVGVNYYILVNGFGPADTGSFEMSVTCSAPCITCSPSYVPEGEACGDDVNGGCNMAAGTEFYQPINCGDTICGSAWADGFIRDTDWFLFTVSTPGIYTMTAKTSFPGLMGYIGPFAGAPTTADCAGISTFTDLVLSFNECDSIGLTGYLAAGTWVYFIAPSTFTGYPCGSGKNDYITYVCAPNPPITVSNDVCDSAILITQNATCNPTSGDVAGAIIQTGPSCAFFAYAEDDVWYKWVATSASAIVEVTGSASFDPVYEVLDACGGNNIACINNSFGGGSTESQIVSGLTVGQTYYIRVYDAGFQLPATTGFTICVYDVPPPPPNDGPCGALPLSVGSNGPYNTLQATVDVGEPAPSGFDCVNSWCNPDLNNTLWFTIVAPPSGRIAVQSPGFDTQLALYEASNCNDINSGLATLLIANDDDPDYILHNGVLFSSYFEYNCLTPGNTYYLQLDGYFSPGITTIELTDLGPVNPAFGTLNARYCPTVTSVTLTPVTAGGTFSGPGVSGNIFNPSVAGVGGPYDIVYSLFGCINDTETTVVEYPVADITPSGPQVNACFNQPITLSTPYDPGYTYKWRRNTVLLPGIVGNTYTPIYSGNYKYKVRVTDTLGGGCYSKDSVMYLLINFPNPHLTIGACTGGTVLLGSDVNDPNLNYQWVHGTTPINGATNMTYLVTVTGGYRLAITDSCGTLRFTPLTHISVAGCRLEEMPDEVVSQMVDVVLFPNPNDGNFNLNLEAYDFLNDPASVQILNVLGQEVYSNQFSLDEGKLNTVIHLPNAEDGLYTVCIRRGDFVSYQKIVITK